MNLIAVPELDRRAAAIADVKQMHDDLTDAHAIILQLRADLHRCEDRVVMLVEQCDRYRHSELFIRKLAMKLAHRMGDVELLLVAAREAVHEIDEMDDAPTPPTEVIDRMEVGFKQGNAEGA